MRVLVSGATKTIREYLKRYPENHGRIGHLINPQCGNRIETLLLSGLPIAADNGAYSGFDEALWFAMLRRLWDARVWYGRRLWWAAVPDVVADAVGTLERWRYYHHALRAYWLPAAFVAQDGCDQLH